MLNHLIGLNKLIKNIHFWTIILIMAAVATMYYKWNPWFPWYQGFILFEVANDLIGSLFLIPFIYTCLVFRLWGPIVIWFVAFAALVPIFLLYYGSDYGSLLRNTLFTIAPMAVLVIVVIELKWRDKQRKIQDDRDKERKLNIMQIFRAQENERRRIARELHDGTIQELAVIGNRAQSILSDDDYKEDAKEQIGWIRDIIFKISEDIRRISLDLRPAILDEAGLVPALRWLADHLSEESNINTRVQLIGIERKLPSEIENPLFRIAQEALNNIRRHSEATEAKITINYASECVKMTIEDSGKGFYTNDIDENLINQAKAGIKGMQERVKLLDGIINIRSQIGKGTTISIEIADYKGSKIPT